MQSLDSAFPKICYQDILITRSLYHFVNVVADYEMCICEHEYLYETKFTCINGGTEASHVTSQGTPIGIIFY